MAELGHPILGPQSFWKLTHGEIRIYAEGFKAKAEKDRGQSSESLSGPGRSGPSPGSEMYEEAKQAQQKRDREALERVEQRVQNQQ